jgi:hypothetical protein
VHFGGGLIHLLVRVTLVLIVARGSRERRDTNGKDRQQLGVPCRFAVGRGTGCRRRTGNSGLPKAPQKLIEHGSTACGYGFVSLVVRVSLVRFSTESYRRTPLVIAVMRGVDGTYGTINAWSNDRHRTRSESACYHPSRTHESIPRHSGTVGIQSEATTARPVPGKASARPAGALKLVRLDVTRHDRLEADDLHDREPALAIANFTPGLNGRVRAHHLALRTRTTNATDKILILQSGTADLPDY